jgi:hypothetical protein
MAGGKISKAAVAAFKSAIPDLQSYYSKEKMNIDKSLKITPEIYDGALAVMYATLNAPPTFFKKTFGSIPGFIFNTLYSVLVMPFKGLISLFDLRTWKNFITTIFGFVTECLPSVLTKLFKKMFEALGAFYQALSKASKGVKKLEQLHKKHMLLESKKIHMESRIWDWFKNTAYKIASKFKDAAFWFLKKGFAVIEKPYMAVLQPFAECMSRVNKMGGSLYALKSVGNSAMIGKFLTMIGLGGLAVTGGGLAMGTMLSGTLVIMGWTAVVFSVATYLNMVGQFIEFKNMIVDVFE